VQSVHPSNGLANVAMRDVSFEVGPDDRGGAAALVAPERCLEPGVTP
jgi:hypothetical protein